MILILLLKKLKLKESKEYAQVHIRIGGKPDLTPCISDSKVDKCGSQIFKK